MSILYKNEKLDINMEKKT